MKMGHDQREGSPIVTDLPMSPSIRRRNDIIKCLHDARMKSSSSLAARNDFTEIPPRSPLSKAFDFFPWSKCKKTLTDKNVNDRKDEIHQKNMLRNGGIIRDILSDKLIKNKGIYKDSLYNRQNPTKNRKNMKRISRNKSLDIEDILQKCEEQLRSDDDSHTTTFLDDTFIENYMRNEPGQQYQHQYQQQQHQQQQQQQHQQQKDHNENITTKNLNNQKHILFNDENIIYLIRKEKPVMKSSNNGNNKEKTRMGLKQKNEENNNHNHNNGGNIYADGNVIKARLKFKKIAKS